MSIENAASSILQRAVTLENEKRYTESMVCYQEGIQLLVNFIKGNLTTEKKTYFRTKIESYMDRAEYLKKIINDQKDAGIFHEQTHIESNSVGHSYASVFGRFLDEDVVQVRIEDPYVRNHYQCQNFLRLCELLVTTCENLKDVCLVTTPDNHEHKKQMEWLQMISNSLKNHNRKLTVEMSSTLHDRQIILSSGWVIKIGRGLDYFKAPENNFTLGMHNMDMRPCHETTVDIFHTKTVRNH